MPNTRSASKPESAHDDSSKLDTPALRSNDLRMSYEIARGEMGVLTFEPYKSLLLPYWRFRTPDIALKSSQDLWKHFEHYGREGDFVGMDMARKFIQMGMTRAKRYANHKGGKKYETQADKNGNRVEKPKSVDHKDKKEKEEASLIFREVWERCKADVTYNELKEQFQAEKAAARKAGG